MSVEAFVAEKQAEARWKRALVRISSELIDVVRPEDVREIGDFLVAWLDTVCADMPDMDPFGSVRADADFWADIATTAELEAYTAAGLRRIERRGFALTMRKRLFVMLWQTMPESDRRAFIARVDPKGKFRGRAA